MHKLFWLSLRLKINYQAMILCQLLLSNSTFLVKSLSRIQDVAFDIIKKQFDLFRGRNEGTFFIKFMYNLSVIST